jgi:hypothetical protein
MCAKLFSGGVDFAGLASSARKFWLWQTNYCSNYVTGDQALAKLLDRYVLFFTIDWITNLQNPNKQKCRFPLAETNRFGLSHTESREPALQASFGVLG